MSLQVLVRIIKAVPNCVMVKHEDWPGLNKMAGLREAGARGETRRISILSGNGALFLPEELDRGSDGAMTGFGYPEMMVGICKAHAAGEHDRMRDIFDADLPLARYEQQPGQGLAVRKYILVQRGAFSSAMVRRPGQAVSAKDRADISVLIARQSEKLKNMG